MCGIFGAVWLRASSAVPKFDGAIEALRFRGPDDKGLDQFDCGPTQVAMGHTRLSIIDLSSAGHQPMVSKDGKFSIVFNGEIYNYLELRSDLMAMGHEFVSNSDTEVLLTAWRQWGAECLPRLVGMFAFAVLDKISGTLTCVRDAFGIKPFFYTKEQDAFFFASEIPAIKALKRQKLALNWQRAYDYLVHGDYDSSAESFVEDVFHLQPGHALTVDLTTGNAAIPSRWWKPSIQERTDLNFQQAAELVRESFLESIRLHLRSDVAIGAALSGGIDSSAVVCAIRHIEPDVPINTFSYIARDSSISEETWVDRINGHVGAKAHKVTVSAAELGADLDEMIRVQGEPFGGTSIYAQFRVFRLARESGVTVTLDGQGADELLAGYNGYPGQRIRSLLEKGRVGEAWDFLNAWAQWPGRSRMAGAKRAVAELTGGRLYHALRRFNGMRDIPTWINAETLVERGIIRRYPRQRAVEAENGRRVAAELALSLTQRGLPALLRHGDRNSMRFSVESRVPFLTTKIANLVLSLPEEYLISQEGQTKHVFRAAMRGIVPDQILDRRDKIGFETPEQQWLKTLGQQARKWLEEDPGLPFLNMNVVRETFDRMLNGREPFSWQAWRWINFCRWYAAVMQPHSIS